MRTLTAFLLLTFFVGPVRAELGFELTPVLGTYETLSVEFDLDVPALPLSSIRLELEGTSIPGIQHECDPQTSHEANAAIELRLWNPDAPELSECRTTTSLAAGTSSQSVPVLGVAPVHSESILFQSGKVHVQFFVGDPAILPCQQFAPMPVTTLSSARIVVDERVGTEEGSWGRVKALFVR